MDRAINPCVLDLFWLICTYSLTGHMVLYTHYIEFYLHGTVLLPNLSSTKSTMTICPYSHPPSIFNEKDHDYNASISKQGRLLDLRK